MRDGAVTMDAAPRDGGAPRDAEDPPPDAREPDAGAHLDAAGWPDAELHDAGALDSGVELDADLIGDGGTDGDSGLQDSSVASDAAIVRDAGTDATICLVTPELCNGRDDDCDGVVDGPVATHSCALDHSIEDCRAGECVVAVCDVGWADCNGRSRDGCESDLENEMTCGACTRSCGAVERCAAGTCGPARLDRLSSDGETTCLLRPSGTAYCWGSNQSGQCGSGLAARAHGAAVVVGISDFVDIEVGASHACGVTVDGSLFCWGYNAQGQLGVGDTTNRPTPARVPGISDAVEVSAGGLHTCVRHASRRVSCWGANFSGELGDGTTIGRATPREVFGVTDAVDLEAGGSHTCVLLGAGGMRCWGSNQAGTIGDGTLVDRLTPRAVIGLPPSVDLIRAGMSSTCARTTSGEMWCWGYQSQGALCQTNGSDATLERPTRMMGISGASDAEGNEHHSTITLRSGAAYSCGNGQGGHLGDGSGSLSYSFLPTRVLGIADGIRVALGRDHTCVLRATGAVACWGSNTSEQLGDGTTIQSATPISVIGLPP